MAGGLSRESAVPVSLRGLVLPLFITEDNRWFVGALMYGTAAAMYLATNHLHYIEPRLLPMTWVDLNVPLLPNTVWVYVSEYLYFAFIYWLCRETRNLNKYFYSFMALQIVSSIIFILWPTTYPRDSYPLPVDLNALTQFGFSTLRSADSAANCCPSLHVSSVYLCSFIFLDEQRAKFPFVFLYGTLITLSTLTTKQHYLVDVVTGFLIAVVFYWVFHRFVSYRSFSQKSAAAPA